MRKFFFLPALAVIIVGTVSLLSGCGNVTTTTNQGVVSYKVGDVVAVKWADDNWYHAKVDAVVDGKYDVTFDDGIADTGIEASNMKNIPTITDLKVGDKVMAVGSDSGRFYLGTVTALTADGATMQWDDGSADLTVKLSNIMRP